MICIVDLDSCFEGETGKFEDEVEPSDDEFEEDNHNNNENIGAEMKEMGMLLHAMLVSSAHCLIYKFWLLLVLLLLTVFACNVLGELGSQRQKKVRKNVGRSKSHILYHAK